MLYLYNKTSETYLGEIKDLDTLEYYHLIGPYGDKYAFVDEFNRELNFDDIKNGIVNPFSNTEPPTPYKRKHLKRSSSGKSYRNKMNSAKQRDELSRIKSDSKIIGKHYSTEKAKQHTAIAFPYDGTLRSHKGRTWKQKKIRYQWQKNMKEASVSRIDGCYKIPDTYSLLGKTVTYIGESIEFFTFGSQYRVVDTGWHWYKQRQFVVWVTDDSYDGDDVDYCAAFHVDTFNEFFIEENFSMFESEMTA